MSPLDLFRSGYDYIEVAAQFGTTEAVIERVIDRLRSSERMEDRQKAANAKFNALALLRRKARDSAIWERTKADLSALRERRPA